MIKILKYGAPFILIGLLVVGRTAVNADCLGCPPTATYVTLSLHDGTTLTGYLIVHNYGTEEVIDEQRIDPEYFPAFSPNATEQQNALAGKAFLYRTGTTRVPSAVKGYTFYDKESRYTRLLKEDYQGISEILLARDYRGNEAIILIGAPITCSIASIAHIERRSETYSDVWYLSAANEKYLHQVPKSAFDYKDEFDGHITCFYYTQEVTLEYLLDEVDLQTIVEHSPEGEEKKDGVVCFQIGGLT